MIKTSIQTISQNHTKIPVNKTNPNHNNNNNNNNLNPINPKTQIIKMNNKTVQIHKKHNQIRYN